ncbi:MAG TPA: hypothetical protein VEZ14_11565 [Dehalococcoidia bacterium]|nr:hypothetical protein [Dehalococcoidia bacterium]
MISRGAGRALAGVLLAAAAVVAACGGGPASGTSQVSFPTVVTLGGCEVCPQINNQSLAVGDNRVSIGLTDRQDNQVLDARVHLRFYDLSGRAPVFLSEAEAQFVPITLAYVDSQNANRETTSGASGVYVAHATFTKAGDWGVQISITRGGKALKPIPYRFTVLEHSSEPEVGEPAPPSQQQTVATAPNIEAIDSSYPPRTAMHEITVADALKTGKPIVLAFATPAFCTSRTCAPVMDTVMDPLYAAYHDQAIFIHIEPYDLGPLRQSNIEEPVRATREWRLQSEPWIFVIGRDRRIAAKFEGPTAKGEVEAVLREVLAAPLPGTPPAGH